MDKQNDTNEFNFSQYETPVLSFLKPFKLELKRNIRGIISSKSDDVEGCLEDNQ